MKRLNGDRDVAADDPIAPEVIERCKQGDERAWAELVQATHRQVYTLCLRILRDPDDAAEATQDAYLKAWRGLKGFRGDALFSTWLFRVATNAALSKHRSMSRRKRREADFDDEALSALPSGASTEEAGAARAELHDVERALAALPEHYRQAVVLRDVYDLPIVEIARQMDITETAAKVRVHRGRKRLKELVWPGGRNDEGRSEV